MNSIVKICQDTVYLSKIEYLSTLEINEALFEVLQTNGVFTGTMANLSQFLTMPTDFKNRQLSEATEKTEQGYLYSYTVSCAFATDNALAKAELNTLLSYRYVLRITNDAGRVYQLGTFDNPCRFQYTKQYGEGTENSFKLNFTLKTATQLLFL